MTSTESAWQPGIDRQTLVARSHLIQTIRHYFQQQGVLEVETPCLSSGTVTDPHLEAMTSGTMYLQTSPEYAMKRLLAAGSGDIFQITKAFRADEAGRQHNPEFTLLEWYRLDYSAEDMYAEIEALLTLLLSVSGLDVLRYQDLFYDHLKVTLESANVTQLQSLCDEHCSGFSSDNRDELLTTLFATCIEPKLGKERPCIVSHFPASQASLARLDPDNPDYALRFEVYYQGLELANGFCELTDAKQQLVRFELDNQQRLLNGKPVMPIDKRLIAALEHGLPDCVGVAMGIDRLLMLKLGKTDIRQVLAFDSSRA